jgi:hypothetical protein
MTVARMAAESCQASGSHGILALPERVSHRHAPQARRMSSQFGLHMLDGRTGNPVRPFRLTSSPPASAAVPLRRPCSRCCNRTLPLTLRIRKFRVHISWVSLLSSTLFVQPCCLAGHSSRSPRRRDFPLVQVLRDSAQRLSGGFLLVPPIGDSDHHGLKTTHPGQLFHRSSPWNGTTRSLTTSAPATPNEPPLAVTPPNFVRRGAGRLPGVVSVNRCLSKQEPAAGQATDFKENRA